MNQPLGQTSPSWAQAIAEAIEARLYDLHVGLPAKVVSFDPATQSCDVQPCLVRVVLDDELEEQIERLPVITNVPIQYAAGGGWSITFPLVPGDIVYLSFAERSIDSWLIAGSPGDEVDPRHNRKHDLTDAIAIPGIKQRSRALADLNDSDLFIGRTGGDPAIILKPDGTIEIGRGATESLVLGDKLKASLDALTVPTALGPSGVPLNAASFPAFLSPKGKVK